MASDVSTIQSLKAVDAWIDVINANINGGVRTAFKASRLKFAGSNTDVARPGTSTNLPLQFPEPSLVTQNTVIDWTQGAITTSTENSHLALQGEGYFVLVDPGSIDATGNVLFDAASTRVLLTRDGEFRTNQNGFLVNTFGWFLVTVRVTAAGSLSDASMRAVYNNMDTTALAGMVGSDAVRLTDFIANIYNPSPPLGGNGLVGWSPPSTATNSIVRVAQGKQSLQYSRYGSTSFEFGFTVSNPGPGGLAVPAATIRLANATPADATILNKSLEASNASMTQSVPELSLAQKLFSALTKVFQTKQTNVDGVLNVIR